MWFSYEKENSWIPLKASRVKELIEMNKKNILPDTLQDNQLDIDDESDILNNDLVMMDKKFQKKKRKGRNKKKRKGNRPNDNRNSKD